jgi:hypothetical protein
MQIKKILDLMYLQIFLEQTHVAELRKLLASMEASSRGNKPCTHHICCPDLVVMTSHLDYGRLEGAVALGDGAVEQLQVDADLIRDRSKAPRTPWLLRVVLRRRGLRLPALVLPSL